ncbi:RidA family protein [Mucilaginibacter sp. KACC 22063]|uniref:RidA family protein n=1 Tax=Mucilaginibacter sp. KACC 22063 TaxID=3025666 RepID=UPI002365BC63|nr:RidA family protein [Mucilaginibacter sp. KACC 22063]WDF55868.1 RidA family protein [Mucilaginibacter sp. KACC 22063]
MTKLITLLTSFTLLIFANTGCKNSTHSKDQPERLHHKTKVTTKEKWHWKNGQKQNESVGYAQVVKTGNTLYISGIPTADLSLKGVAGVYQSLETSLQAFGATPKDVVKETLYTTDIETMKKYNNARKAFYKGDFPAATWLQVSRLY